MYERKEQKPKEGLLVALAKQCGEDSEKWFGDSHVAHSIPHHTLAMAGEVGEFASLVKKVERGSLSLKDARVRHAMAMELTDVLVRLLNIANLLQIDLEKSYEVVRNQNHKRFTEERTQREGK